jgi:peroxiredoxin
VVVFLRYFGCPFSQQQVVNLRGARELFERAGTQVVLIGQGGPDDARRFVEAKNVPFPLYVDPTRAAFRAYGLTNGTVSQVFGPQCMIGMVRRATRPESRQGLLNGGNLMQMPGTFVVDSRGVVRFAHRNETIADDPPVDELLAAIPDVRRAA